MFHILAIFPKSEPSKANYMIKKILICLILAIGIFLLYIAFQSPDYKISRSLAVQQTPATIFPYLNNSKLMDAWSPWRDVDPKVQMQFSGPEEGVGAKTSWSSDGPMGTGSATVVESIPDQSAKTLLSYTKPYPMEQEAVLSLTPSGSGSIVTWTVRGKSNFISRLFCFFMDMDKLVGDQFEKGLVKLQSQVEG